MFERTLEEMTATIIVEKKMAGTLGASNVGLADLGLVAGRNNISFYAAVNAILEIDAALLSCPKHLYKRVRAMRQQIVLAFGPDMENYLK